MKKVFSFVAIAAMTLFVTSCDETEAVEDTTAGEMVEETVEATEEVIEETVEAVEEMVEDAEEATEEAVEEAEEVVEEETAE